VGEVRNSYKILVGKPDGKKPLRRRRRRWEDNIKMDIKVTGYEDVDWIYLIRDRHKWRSLLNTGINLRVLVKCGELLDQLSNYCLLKIDSTPLNWLFVYY
jgi:hypothetical protein